MTVPLLPKANGAWAIYALGPQGLTLDSRGHQLGETPCCPCNSLPLGGTKVGTTLLACAQTLMDLIVMRPPVMRGVLLRVFLCAP